MTRTAIPPIVIVAARLAAPTYGDTEMPTVPLPVPLEPEVIVAHVLSETAVHEHPDEAKTKILRVPPAEVADRFGWLIVTLHD